MIQNIVKHIHFESFSFNADTINTHNYFTSFSKFFIVQFTDYSKWKMISFFTITTVLILYSIYMHDTGKIIMCISDIIFISFCYWYYKKKEAK